MGDCRTKYIKADTSEGAILEFVRNIWGKLTETVSAYSGKRCLRLEPDISQMVSLEGRYRYTNLLGKQLVWKSIKLL
jgi:hypothetical protein